MTAEQHRCGCGRFIAEGRYALGYRTCLECGAVAADNEIKEKSKRVVLNTNKGAYQYLTPGQRLDQIGKKL